MMYTRRLCNSEARDDPIRRKRTTTLAREADSQARESSLFGLFVSLRVVKEACRDMFAAYGPSRNCLEQHPAEQAQTRHGGPTAV